MQCYLPVWDVTFEGLTSVLLKTQVIQDVMLCHWVFSFWMFRRSIVPSPSWSSIAPLKHQELHIQ